MCVCVCVCVCAQVTCCLKLQMKGLAAALSRCGPLPTLPGEQKHERSNTTQSRLCYHTDDMVSVAMLRTLCICSVCLTGAKPVPDSHPLWALAGPLIDVNIAWWIKDPKQDVACEITSWSGCDSPNAWHTVRS